MNTMELSQRFALMWQQSRTHACKSQAYMAEKLGVSKRTIQNWEDGLSCPNQIMALEWFNILNEPPLPYYIKTLFPKEYEKLNNNATDQEIENALIHYIKLLPPDAKAKLLFVIYGEHGSTFPELIEMLTAHFHTPDENRITIAQNICTNFEIAKATGTIVSDNKVMPDIKILKNAIIKKRNRILGTNDQLKE